MALPTVQASPFARTEIPEDLTMRFLKPGGQDPVNLTGYTANVEIVLPDNSATTKSADIADAENGKIRYVFQEGDLDLAGTYKFQFRVSSGSDPVTTRLYSSIVELTVFDTPKDGVQ
jgi:hypothetical protein